MPHEHVKGVRSTSMAAALACWDQPKFDHVIGGKTHVWSGVVSSPLASFFFHQGGFKEVGRERENVSKHMCSSNSKSTLPTLPFPGVKNFYNGISVFMAPVRCKWSKFGSHPSRLNHHIHIYIYIYIIYELVYTRRCIQWIVYSLVFPTASAFQR